MLRRVFNNSLLKNQKRSFSFSIKSFNKVYFENWNNRNIAYQTKALEIKNLLKQKNINDLIDMQVSNNLSEITNYPSKEEATNDIIHLFHYAIINNLYESMIKLTNKYPELLENKQFLYDGMIFATMFDQLEILKFLGQYATKEMFSQLYKNHVNCINYSTFMFFINKGVNMYDGYDAALQNGYKTLDKLVKMSKPENLSQDLFEKIANRYAYDNNQYMLDKVLSFKHFKHDYPKMIEQSISNDHDTTITTPLFLLLDCVSGKYNYNHALEYLIKLNGPTLSLFRKDKTKNIIKFLIKKGGVTNNPRLVGNFASLGDLDTVKWLIDNGIEPINDYALVKAFLENHHEIVSYLIDRGNIRAILTNIEN